MGKITVTYERESPFPDWVTPGVLKAMSLEGKSLRDIAEHFSTPEKQVTPQTVLNWIRKVKDFTPPTTL